MVRGQLLASGVGLLLVEVAVERIFVPMHSHTSLEDDGGGVRRWLIIRNRAYKLE